MIFNICVIAVLCVSGWCRQAYASISTAIIVARMRARRAIEICSTGALRIVPPIPVMQRNSIHAIKRSAATYEVDLPPSTARVALPAVRMLRHAAVSRCHTRRQDREYCCTQNRRNKQRHSPNNPTQTNNQPLKSELQTFNRFPGNDQTMSRSSSDANHMIQEGIPPTFLPREDFLSLTARTLIWTSLPPESGSVITQFIETIFRPQKSQELTVSSYLRLVIMGQLTMNSTLPQPQLSATWLIDTRLATHVRSAMIHYFSSIRGQGDLNSTFKSPRSEQNTH